MRDVVRPRSRINAASVQGALRKGEFIPYFQPIVVMRTGQLAGFEVLARWKHPELGLVGPDRFIPVVEKDGSIDTLTQQILHQTFASACTFPESLTLSINISPLQLRNSGLPEMIRAAAKPFGYSLEQLVIEITESALIGNLSQALGVAEELKAMGCKIALDDFGTGYSSLLHLQSLPFDELKVDRSFVNSMTRRRESRKIVAAVVGLGQSLGLRTVAEGIEVQEQAEMMLWLGCELGQGWFYGKPVPAEGLADTLSHPRKTLTISSSSPWTRISAANIDISPTQRLAQLQAVYDGAPVGLAFIDQSLRYVNLNSKLADMNGASVEEHLGSKVSEIIPDLFPQVEPLIRRALEGEAIANVEVQSPDSGETCLVSYQPARDEAGEVVGVSIASLDITARKQAEEALQESENHYRKMVELNPQVLWIMDPHGKNLDPSPRWEKSTGSMKIHGSDHGWLDRAHPDDLERTNQAIAVSRQNGSPIDVEFRVASGDDTWRWMRSRGTPRFDNTGKIVCWYGSVEDIDPIKRTPADGAAMAQVFSPEPADQEYPAEGSTLPYQPPMGVPSILDSTMSLSDAASNIDPDYIRVQALHELDLLDTPPEAEFDDLVKLACEICSTPISLVSLVDSDRQWFKASVGLETRETPISTSFCVHAIRRSGLFIVKDAVKDVRFRQNPLVVGDPKIRFYAGVPLHAGEGVAVGTLCVIDTVPRSLTPGQARALVILSHQVQAHIELRTERKKLLKAVASNTALAATLETNNRVLSDANLQLEQLATTDVLTGLLNRRAFEVRMKVEVEAAQSNQEPLSLMVMDIDDFKKRNDEFGHAAGDDALRHLGQVLREVLPAGNYAARTGGEEFAVILPETTTLQAIMFSKRIQKLLGSYCLGYPPISVSIGIASLETSTRSWETLFSQADLAMYDAKHSGKSRVVVYGERHHEPSPPSTKTSAA